jgi:hypothetical protein
VSDGTLRENRERWQWFLYTGRCIRLNRGNDSGYTRREATPAAKCDRCGTIGIVRVCADGALRLLGQSTICDCNGETLRVLETDPDDGEEV